MNTLKKILEEMVNVLADLMLPRHKPVPIPVRNKDRRR